MEFIRENILKIVIAIVVFFVAIFIFTVACGGKGGIVRVKSYVDMENNLVLVTKKYISANESLLPKSEEKPSKINMDTLINSEYMKEQSAIEDENVKCTGYTEVINKDGNYIYIPYVKCGKYYETKTIAKQILSSEEVVTEGDGLYEFGDTYVYRGENPNNYLKLGEKIYRILEINENNELKLISTKRYLQSVVWDNRYNIEKNKSYGINDYSKSRLKEVIEVVLDNEEFFSSQEREKIIGHDFCVGKRNPEDYSKTTTAECSVMYPNQKLGLLLPAEYSRVSTDSNCNSLNSYSCSNYNYLETITSTYISSIGSSKDTYNVLYMSNGILDVRRASSSFSPYFVTYIDKLSIYSSGDGTENNPYTVR